MPMSAWRTSGVSSRAKREWNSIQRGMRDRALGWGQVLLWFVKTDSSGENDIYDEGGRRWLPGVALPAYSVVRMEGPEGDRPEGQYVEERLDIVLVPKVWFERGLPEPDEKDRVNDRIRFEDKLYSVNNFQLQGRFAGFVTVFRVEATQVQDDELVLDVPTGT